VARLDMDHRWGMRTSVNLDVQLICQPGAIAPGRLTDVSVSGAYVRTKLDLRILTHVRIVLLGRLPTGGRAMDLSAYVVRQDGNGAGLEWWNLSPGILHKLLLAAAPAAGAVDRSVASLRN